MTNHIHLLATAGDKTSISNTMEVAGSRYAQYINKNYNRTGILWERRHKSSLVQADKYFLICSRYIELNPVVANMVKRPEEYAWSSYHSNAWGDASWITQHDEYRRLGNTPEKRCQQYRQLFKHDVDSEDIDLIRKAMHYCQPVGDDHFKKMLEQKYGIKIGQTRKGRPVVNGKDDC